ncbi:hypothetical protein GALL_503870 [mine drainage metagenome]|uniref:Uncharacterized protein n=1 Tax=mine drainage metagenome TaxID=410659 RepID=A0A1J5PRW4_9ZZZZ
MADAFHQAAVTQEHVGMVVDDFVAGKIELARQHLLGEGHAHGIGQPLAQRAGGGFHAGGVADFGVPRGLAVQLAEALEFLNGEVVAGEVQQGVDQHRTVTVGQHEAVAVGPMRIGRVVVHVVAPQHLGDVGHAHRRAGVTGLGGFDPVDGKKTDGVGQAAALLGVERAALGRSGRCVHVFTPRGA